ncbi:uncharacterized protein LOC143253458 isoform X1 [Tachypleus tridentatus]|uniref:uncharacterized protein LOC143253458 isoform X1 n=1 Tax=Tachypleus tridentatus TaxID=6853 RepID=UPI003FD3AB97
MGEDEAAYDQFPQEDSELHNCDSYLELTPETLILQANVGLTLLLNLHEVNRRKANLYEKIMTLKMLKERPVCKR